MCSTCHGVQIVVSRLIHSDESVIGVLKESITSSSSSLSDKDQYTLNLVCSLTVGNSSKLRDIDATETVDNVEKPSFTMRSMPRRCLSVEETATNYRTTLAPPLRLPPVYLEMENMRRPQTSRIRRYRSNYPVGKRVFHVRLSSLDLLIPCFHVTAFSARSYRREQQPAEVMMPTGLPIHKQIYVEDFDSDYEYYTTTDDQPIKPVPIWLCVFLVVSYIFGGAFLFSAWEQWPFLDSAYFCFITLTTIGESLHF